MDPPFKHPYLNKDKGGAGRAGIAATHSGQIAGGGFCGSVAEKGAFGQLRMGDGLEFLPDSGQGAL